MKQKLLNTTVSPEECSFDEEGFPSGFYCGQMGEWHIILDTPQEREYAHRVFCSAHLLVKFNDHYIPRAYHKLTEYCLADNGVHYNPTENACHPAELCGGH